jgi:hypothetical protein
MSSDFRIAGFGNSYYVKEPVFNAAHNSKK